MKLNTVNVVEYVDGTISSVRSFSDDEDGNKEAEELFAKIALENDFDADDVDFGLDEGVLEKDDTGYQLSIVHSQN